MAIMHFSKTALKNLVSRPATRKYPKKQRTFFDRTRGAVDIKIDECIFCSLCARKCPTGALAVSKPEQSWHIDRLKCIQCSGCVETCPKKCLSMNQSYTTPSQGPSANDYKNA